MTQIRIRGARQNNLKNVDNDIPRHQIVVFTGVSGSGKSSLVFETINAEAQSQLTGRAGMRTTVAVDWPVGYLALNDYAGLRASAIDLVGPLGELALREVGDWQDEKLVLLDFLRPKVGVWFVVPQLSRRLIIDAGIGVRFIGTDELTGDATGGTYKSEITPEIHFGLSYVL